MSSFEIHSGSNPAPGESPDHVLPAVTPVQSGIETDAGGELSRLSLPLLSRKTELEGASEVLQRALPPVAEAWREVLTKLFDAPEPGEHRIVYDQELAQLEASLAVPPGTLLEVALDELEASAGSIETDGHGRISNSEALGEAFSALYKLAIGKVDVSIAASREALYDSAFPLGREMAAVIEPIVVAGEAVTVMLVKEPPQSAADELRDISEKRLGGLMSLWQNRELWDGVGVSPALRGYLDFATVRILSTGSEPEHGRLARSVNLELERKGGFEDAQWASMVKGISQGDRHHALKEALTVCIPVVVGVKALESFAPGLMHSVGGMLDDLFGAIIPDVSQSMGKKGLPFSERFKEAWPVLREGLISLPVAVGLGWGAAALHGASHSTVMHGVAGALFALACSAGTVGTSIGAFRKASAEIEKLRADPVVGAHLEDLGRMGRIRLALQESIFDVPFRVGHTVIGVPAQLALGIAAGVGGFFHNGLFVMAEGVLETALGAATAFGYPGIKAVATRSALKNLKPS